MVRLGAFAIVFDGQGKILLCHRRDMDAWNLPGGVVEDGELPNDAVIREVFEETGLKVDIERLAGIYLKPRELDLVFSFVCRIIGGEMATSEEADRLVYFHPSALPANTAPKQVERIEDAIKFADLVFRKQEGMSTEEMLEEQGLK
jgi:ADP-ribose pyrophosphatase YjhB (NUDIX family)